MSLPSRERELKPSTAFAIISHPASLPSRERELKRYVIVDEAHLVNVAPFTGA